jgi:hypothetical protein
LNIDRTPRPDAPGWYPDAESGRMRRWDGNRWTGESRDLPPWAGAGTAARRSRTRRHWIISFAVISFLFVVVSLKAINAGTDLPPRTVFDAAFISEANGKCRETLVPLKDARPVPGSPEGKNPGPHEKVAAQVDDVADRLAALADDLRDVPVRAAEQSEVQGWLASWDTYAAIGHDYADAVREQSGAQTRLARDGASTGRRANLFARANKLDDCTFS